ncbi:MAG TPA: hypothetical protein VFI69_11565 [Candidatus Limnocylindrales bacterium]|jgi:hypothetical protein|nr:hypothetical protein [Candidatus Limnocylindrales bacterium]
MAAYAVIARIGRVDPHLTLRDVDARDALDPPDGPSPGSGADVIDTAPMGRVHAWLGSLREGWAQTTFYLFDPESWRS